MVHDEFQRSRCNGMYIFGVRTDEAEEGEYVRSDDERPSDRRPVGPNREDDGCDHSEYIQGNGQKLSIRGRVAQVPNDCRYRVVETVQTDTAAILVRQVAAPFDHGIGPRSPVAPVYNNRQVEFDISQT